MNRVPRALFAIVVCTVLAACGKTPDPQTADDAKPKERKTHFPTCRWVPITPEWNEPCDINNRGAVLKVNIREDNRPGSAQEQNATCQCD